MFLLDTNVLSELRRRKVGERRVLAWAEKVDPSTLFLSAITVLEVEQGALLLKQRDVRQAGVLEQWIRTVVLPSFSGRILPFDEMAALRCAALHVSATHPERDAMIAATALVHGMMMVTRNIRDFAAMGVPLFNPWTD